MPSLHKRSLARIWCQGFVERQMHFVMESLDKILAFRVVKDMGHNFYIASGHIWDV